jgi:signal transduction histidine kinase
VTLTNRLSAFFLGALAVVLVGFSVALFLLARAAAYRDLDRRVQGAIDAMSSAVEVKPNGVDWEPNERGFTLSAHASDAPVGWGVFDDTGTLIARSPGAHGPEFLAQLTGREGTQPLRDWRDERGQVWRVALKRINATEPYLTARPRRKMATVQLAAGLPTAAAEAELRQVGAVLAVTSCGVWVLAALLVRRLCRRALAPVRSMARAARAARAADLSSRLPEPPARDELTDLARSFNDLLDRVQEAYERQRSFTSEASHQLRTPLAGILAQTAVALRAARSADGYRRVLQTVHDRADDLRLMVEALLFLSRADGDAPAPDPELFDVAAWLRTAHARWAERPGGSDVRLVVPPGGAWVLAAPVFLAPLLDNLVDNALKYRFPGTPVTVSVEPLGGRVAVRVADLGPGIAARDLPRVFEPFFRTRDAQLRGVPGLGLGLAVARRLARALGGTLTVESEPGCGSRFTLVLPVSHPGEE